MCVADVAPPLLVALPGAARGGPAQEVAEETVKAAGSTVMNKVNGMMRIDVSLFLLVRDVKRS